MAESGPIPAWRHTGSRRRLLLLLIVLIPTVISSNTMARLLPDRGSILLDTFLVRTVTVPAMATLVGKANWWPSRLTSQGSSKA